jgi:hypothetical protein
MTARFKAFDVPGLEVEEHGAVTDDGRSLLGVS